MCPSCDDAAWKEVVKLEAEILDLECWLEQHEHEGEQFLLQREFNRNHERCEYLRREVDKIKRQLNRECTSPCDDGCSMTWEQTNKETSLYLTMSVG